MGDTATVSYQFRLQQHSQPARHYPSGLTWLSNCLFSLHRAKLTVMLIVSQGLSFFHHLHLLLNRLPPILSHNLVISIYIYTFHHLLLHLFHFVCHHFLPLFFHYSSWMILFLLYAAFAAWVGRLLYNIFPIVPVCIVLKERSLHVLWF